MKKASTSFRDHQQSKCHLVALTFGVTVSQCLDIIALQTCSPNPGTTKNACLESSPKKICRIIITNFLLSFSIYLVSLSLYTKLVYKVLFKRHLIFVVNINPVFSSLHRLEAPLYLNLQQLVKLDFKPKLLLRILQDR